MIGSTFLKLLPTAHLHLRRDLSLETSKNTYPVVYDHMKVGHEDATGYHTLPRHMASLVFFVGKPE